MAMKSARQGIAAFAAETGNQYLTFTLGNEVFGVPIGHIKEIIEYNELTSVPTMPAAVRGVVNLRGAVVPVLDLELRFGREPSAIGKRSCIVIFEQPSEAAKAEEMEEGAEEDEASAQYLGMIVDAVNEVLEIPAKNMEPAPSFGTSSVHADLIRAMGKVEGRFVIILDVAKVLALDGLEPLNLPAVRETAAV